MVQLEDNDLRKNILKAKFTLAEWSHETFLSEDDDYKK